ncbi:pilin [Patescibacteria group bacterium]|nr:pilin [Patescibacteria group bacterium]
MFLKHKTLITIIIIGLGVAIALPTFASWPATPLLPPCATDTQTGMAGHPICGFNDFILLGVNLTKMILGLVGSLALLFFIYGGVMFLLAGGKSEMIEKGKKIITNAVIGVAIVLGAWIIVNFAIAALTGTPVSNVKIFGTQDWWRTPGAETTAPSDGTPTPSGETPPPSGGASGTGGGCHCSGTLTTGILADIGDYCGSLSSYCSTCETDRAVCDFTLSVSEADCADLNIAARDNHPSDILPLLGMPAVAGALVDIEGGSCAFEE